MDEKPVETPWIRIVLWGLVCVVMCLWLLPAHVRSWRPPAGSLADFFQDWAATQYHREGRSIYDDQHDAASRELGQPFKKQYAREAFNEVNAHPPFAVLLVLPFSSLDYPTAQLVWTIVWHLTVPLSVWLVLSQLKVMPRPWILLVWIPLLLWCMPLREEVVQGQFNRAILLLVVLTWTFDRNEHQWLAGACLALAVSIKILPAFLALYFLTQRRWRVLGSALVVGMLVNGVAAWVFGFSAYPEYFLRVAPGVAERYRDVTLNISLIGYWTRLFDPVLETAVPLIDSAQSFRILDWLSRIAIAGVAGWICWRAKTSRARDFAFATTLAGTLLLSPITWAHYCLLLLPLGALLWRDLPGQTWRRGIFLASLGYLWVYTRLVLVYLGSEFWTHTAQPWESLTYLGCATYALVAFFVLGAVESGRAKASVAGEELEHKSAAHAVP